MLASTDVIGSPTQITKFQLELIRDWKGGLGKHVHRRERTDMLATSCSDLAVKIGY